MEDKTSALRVAAEKEKSLRAEYEIIRIENNRLMVKQSQSAVMHRQVTYRLGNDLQTMIANRNDLDHELRERVNYRLGWKEKSMKSAFILLINAVYLYRNPLIEKKKKKL